MKDKSLTRRLAVVFAVCLAAAMMLFVSGCSCSKQEAPETVDDTPSKIVEVPNVVSLKKADAQKIILHNGLVLGNVSYDYSDSVPNGSVISQNPEALAQVDRGSSVDIVVSKGKKAPAEVDMPNLIGMSQTDAEKALSDAKLVAVQGDPIVTTDVDPGKVCMQSVDPGTKVKEGTKVTFATALAPDTVTVPDETGKAQADAQADLENAGLGWDITTAYSDTVDEGVVMSQSVAANTQVAKGTIVTLQVSMGAQPTDKVTVPNVYTYTKDDAIYALMSAGLNGQITGDEDGTVIAMSPDAGTEVDPGTTVVLTLQHASTLVTVPDVSGLSGQDAYAAMKAVGLDFDYDTNNPDMTVDSTSPAAGDQVDLGSVIEAVYEPDGEVVVPDVSGLAGPDALAAMQAVGLDLDYDMNNPDMIVDSTAPAAGETVDQGTVIEAVYEPYDDSGDDVDTDAYVDDGSVDDFGDDTTQY